MNELKIKKIAKEEFISNVMNNLDSTLIFTYIQNLEQKANNLQSKIDKVNELLEGRKERVEDLSWVEMKVEDYIEEINEIEFILKEDK